MSSNGDGVAPALAGYRALLIMGGIGVTTIFCTVVFSKKLHRHPTWTNFCLTWIISTLCYLVLFFAGRQTGPEPGYELCLFQASLVYGSPPMTATSTFCLALQPFMTLLDSFKAKPSLKQSAYKTQAMIAIPYVMLFAFALEAFIFGAKFSEQVHRSETGMYCIISEGTPGAISSIFVIIAIVATIIVEVLICRLLLRNWLAFKSFSSRDQGRIGMATPTMLARVVIFTVFSVTVIGICILFIWRATPTGPNLFLSSLPLAVFLVFGTQRDIFKTWMFWKKEKAPVEREAVDLA